MRAAQQGAVDIIMREAFGRVAMAWIDSCRDSLRLGRSLAGCEQRVRGRAERTLNVRVLPLQWSSPLRFFVLVVGRSCFPSLLRAPAGK